MRVPAFWAALAFGLGIVIADIFAISTYLVLSLLVLLLALCLVFLNRFGRILSGLLLFILVLAGLWRYEIATSDFPWNHVSSFLNLEQRTKVIGQIIQEPDIRDDRTYLTVSARELSWKGKQFAVSGNLLIKIKHPSSRFDYGDRISVTGYLFSPMSKRNPGAFDYKRYLNTKGIYGQITLSSAEDVEVLSGGQNLIFNKVVAPARKYLLQHFSSTLAQPYSYFLAGFVLGEKRGMPKELQDKFTRTGTLHLMAVSGSNVALVLVFAFFLSALFRLPNWVRFLFLSLVIVFFALLTNLQPSVVRASVMAFLALLAFCTQRDINFLNLVSFTVLIILFFNPQALFDVSFQLSFASVAAIGILVPEMEAMYNKLFETRPRFFYRWLILPFFVSSAAILGVAPLNVFYFDNFSPIGFFSNLVIVPLVGISVILATLSALVSLFSHALAGFIVAANWLDLKACLASLNFFSDFSFSLVKIPHPPGWVFWVYPLLLGLLFFAHSSRKIRAGLGLAVFLSLVLAGLTKLEAIHRQETALTVLDVSPATALFIELPGQKKMLFLNQASPAGFDYVEQTLLPFLYKKGVNSLDGLIFLDSTYGWQSKLSTLKSNLSIKKLFVLSLDNSDLTQPGSEILAAKGKLLEMEGVKLSLVYPDNKRELLGAVFEFRDFVWLDIDQPDFYKFYNQPTGLPKVDCLNYRLFFQNNSADWDKLKLDEIVIDGWDFRTSGKVGSNLALAFRDRKIWWTRTSGAIQVKYKDRKFRFYPTLEE